MKNRVGEVEEFSFEVLPCDGCHQQQLFVVIAISGWLTTGSENNYRMAWECLSLSKEQYCLRYESKFLLQLGKNLESLASTAVTMLTVQLLKKTALSGLLSAIMWPATLLQLSGLIDHPWYVCMGRSVEVGRILADTLLQRQQGNRPVTLIGYSLGARVIFYCLLEMSLHKDCEGIIEDVVLLGAPVSADPKEWSALDRVVSGRIINGYCSGDWLLKFLYRTAHTTLDVAGLQPVGWKHHRMTNVDITDIVSGHNDYSQKMPDILKFLGIRTKLTVHRKLIGFLRSS